MLLLERDPYLSELSGALAEASRGSGRLALVRGEAGIGKTSLVDRFVRRRDRAVRLFWGTCDALFTPRPLGPLHDMAPQVGGQLVELLSSDAPRMSVFTTVLNELKRRPTIVVFEDVHCADEATLDLLRYIGRRINQTSALLVMTFRDDELSPRHPLRSLLGDLASSSVSRRISLPPLSEAAVQALVGSKKMDAAALHRQTGGNPFYVTEVLANPDRRIPTNVREAVLARAARLSASGYAVLEAAAVIGPRVEPWLLAAVTGAESQATEECMASGMLLAQEDELVFRHELARQTVLDTISPLRRPVLHRLALDALKSSPATRTDLVRLVHHAQGAGDGEEVLAYAPTAAQQAAVASSHREAAALYGLALRYAEDLPPARRAELLEAYAPELALIEERQKALDARQQAADLWREAGNPLKQGENLAYSVRMLIGLGRNAEAEAASRTAIRILEALPPDRELALAYAARAALHLFNRNHADAIAWGEKSIALLEGLDHPAALTDAQLTVGAAWIFQDYERGRSYLETTLESARQAGQEVAVANILTHLGAHSCEMYHFQQAEGYLVEGIAYAAARDLDFLRFIMLAWLALTRLHLGRWEEAAAAADEVLAHPGVSAISRIWALVALGRLMARQGNPEARILLDEAQDVATHAANVQHLGLVRAAQAEAAWLGGDTENVLANVQAAYEMAVSKQHPWITGELAYWRWRAGQTVAILEWMASPYTLHMGGDWQAAAGEWERLGCPYERARALADGDQGAQVQALGIFEKLGAQPDADGLRDRLQAAGAAGIPRRPRASTRENPFGLTRRQTEILALLVEGLTNAEIAGRLQISPKTVDHHVSAVLGKLNVSSRQAAADLARGHPHLTSPK